MRVVIFSLVCSLTFLVGCGTAPPSTAATPPVPPVPPVPTIPAPVNPTPVPLNSQPTVPPVPIAPTIPDGTAGTIPLEQPGATPNPPLAENTEAVVAGVGVGIKGRSLDEYEGVVVTPVKSLFAARERLTFEVSIPQALNLFNAVEGRFPKSHEEFMEKIIAANQIALPELPPNQRYQWDPTQNELMVERPKLKSEPATQP